MQLIEDLSKLRQLNKQQDHERLDLQIVYRVFKSFGRHYKKYWKTIVISFVSLLATIGVSVLQPWPLKLILDHVILAKPLPEQASILNQFYLSSPLTLLALLAGAVVVIAILKSIFSYFNKFLISSTGKRVIADIRERVFSHLQRLSLSFHDSARSGDLIITATGDVGSLKFVLIDFIQDFANSFLTSVVTLGIMLALDWRLGLIGIVTAPIIYLLTRYFGTGMKAAVRNVRDKEGDISSFVTENVSSIALIQAYGREESENERFSKEMTVSLNAQLEGLRLQKTYSRLTDLMATLGLGAMLFFGGLLALRGEILPGTLVVMVAYLKDVFGTVEKFNSLIMGLTNSQVSAERILDLVGNDMIVKDSPKAVAAKNLDGRITFKDVGFSYKPGEDVLHDVSFDIEAGKTVAMVGHSGAGKSTLISLLLRFYDPHKGEILIDGQDIRDLTLKSLREHITIVLQDARLFNQTVRDNIAFGKKGATEEEIINAAKMAEAHDFIMQLPEGYDSIIQEGGDNLSGGQKQRINIARAIIRDTPIVILDEPVTGLDAQSEAKVNAALDRLTKDKTTLIIAHRFSTIKNADMILLLESGKVTHAGSHEQLLATSEEYRELYELQYGASAVLDSANGTRRNLSATVNAE